VPPPDAFLTGSTGFIGGALLSRLVAEGREVAALVRSDPDYEAVRAAGARPVRGDLLDPASLEAGMWGAGAVFHAAGVNAHCLGDSSRMLRVNVEGSLNVVRAAARCGVGRVVYTSSAAAVGEPRGTIGTEATRHRGHYLTRYEQSKHHAEEAVLAEAPQLGLDLVAVNPSSVQGPGRSGGTARILIGYLNGRLRWAVDTTLSIVFIDDCVEGHLLAESAGASGERYILNGAVLTVAEVVDVLGEITGVRRRVRYLPAGMVMAAGHVAGLASRLSWRRQAPFCAEMARALLHGHRYDGSRAARELGLRYTGITEALGRTVAWLRDAGLVSS